MVNMTPQKQGQPTRLEAHRRAAGFSRERLGQRAGAISSATIKRIERGQVVPHPSTKVALATALGCDEEELFPPCLLSLDDEEPARPRSAARSERSTKVLAVLHALAAPHLPAAAEVMPRNRIGLFRRSAGLTTSDLAARVGVSKRTVERWESGEVRISDAKWIALSDLFGVSVVFLMGWPDPSTEENGHNGEERGAA